MKYCIIVNLDTGFIEIRTKHDVLIYEAENLVEANCILKELEAV